jgi:ubiquitin C-terminal hydrolase
MLETSNTPPPPPRRSTRRVADDADDDDDDSATEPDAKASDDVVQVSPRKASSPPAFGRSLRSRRASGLERSMLVDNNNNNNNNNSDVVTVIDSSPVPAKRVSSRKRRPAREEDSFVVSDDEDVSLHVNVGSDDDSDAGTRSDSDNGRKKRGRPKKAHADKLPADKLQPNITSFFSKSAAPPPSTTVKKKAKRKAKANDSESEAEDTEERNLARALAESAAAAGVTVEAADVDAADNDNGRLAVGLANMGATCYVNVLLQCLYANLPFRAAVYQWRHASEPDGPSGGVLPPPSERNSRNAVYQLQRVFAHMQLLESKSFRASALIDMLELEHNYQQDVQEFLVHILDRYGAFLSEASDELRAVRRVPTATFGISLMHQTTCQSCKRVSTHHEPVTMLAVNVSKSLKQSVAESFLVEQLEGDNLYYCERCDQKREASRALRLKELPPYLVIHIKRFSFDMKSLSRKKLHDVIEFPHHFDPSELIVLAESDDTVDVDVDVDDAAAAAFRSERDGTNAAVAAAMAASETKPRSSKRSAPGPQYSLVAAVDHKGSNAGGGHYVSTVYDPVAHAWSLFDDTVVKSVNDSFGKRQSHKSSDVYLLIYRLAPAGINALAAPVTAPEVPPYLRAEVAVANEQWREQEARRRAESDAESARKAVSEQTYQRIAPKLMLRDLPRAKWALMETAFLRAWAHDPLTSRSMAPTRLLCEHDALDPRVGTSVKAVALEGFEALAELRRMQHSVDDARLLQQGDVCAPCLVALADMLRREARFRLDLAALVLEFRQPKKGTIDAAVAQIDDACEPGDDDQSVWVSNYLITLWERAARAEAKLPPSTTRPLSQRLAKMLGVKELMAPPPEVPPSSDSAATATTATTAVDLTIKSEATDDVVVLQAANDVVMETLNDETIAKQLQEHEDGGGGGGGEPAVPKVEPEIDYALYEGASDARRLSRTIGTRGVLPADSTFTSGLVCPHGGLSAAVKARKVSRRVWAHLVETYGDDAGDEVHGATQKCDLCSEFQSNDEKQRSNARRAVQKFKSDQKQQLERLVSRVNEAVYEQPGVFHAVPRVWYDQWLLFVNGKSSLQVPGPIDARSLLCHHGLTMYSADESEFRPTLNRVRFVVVSDDEWNNLAHHYGACNIEADEALPAGTLDVLREPGEAASSGGDADDKRGPSISSLRAKVLGGRRESDLVDIVFDKKLPTGVYPALCDQCATERRATEQLLAASFDSSFIHLHRLPSGLVPHLVSNGDDIDAAIATATDATFEKAATAAAATKGDRIAFFIDRKAGVVALEALLSSTASAAGVASAAAAAAVAAAASNNGSTAVRQRRRATRRSTVPTTVSGVSASMAVANLKMLVFQSIDIDPARQRLFLMSEEGLWQELLDNNTLSDHKVRAGASVVLVEQKVDDDAQLAAVTKQSQGPEKGFSGTWLGGGGIVRSNGSTTDLLASGGGAAAMAVDGAPSVIIADDGDDDVVMRVKQEDEDARMARELQARDDPGKPATPPSSNERQCGACTFINTAADTQCLMCGTALAAAATAEASKPTSKLGARQRPATVVVIDDVVEKRSNVNNSSSGKKRAARRRKGDESEEEAKSDDDEFDEVEDNADDDEADETDEEDVVDAKSKRRKQTTPKRKATSPKRGRERRAASTRSNA